MRYQQINNRFFKENRKKICALLKCNSLAVIHSNENMPRNGDQFYPYRQHSDLFYFTGIEQPDTILVLRKEANGSSYETLFIADTDPALEIWTGKRITPSEASAISGIEEIFRISHFENKTTSYLDQASCLYYNTNENKRYESNYEYKDLRFINTIHQQYPRLETVKLAPLTEKLRVIKSPYEIELLRRAIEITRKAFFRIAGFIRPGIKEYEIEAEITHEFIRNGANGHAYEPIVASGKNACTLHYIKNEATCKKDELVLIDFGAEYANYAADCTRTIPVSGRFNQRQKVLYNAVLYLQQQAISLMKPGKSINKIQQEIVLLAEQQHIKLGLYTSQDIHQQDPDHPLYKNYFMHGIGHFIGLDVHDLGDKNTPLEPGMVLTCEPGIYIPQEKTGIRIENNILITDTGNIDLMNEIPVQAEEIESLMKKK
jgi:Xaa-Pro aminopeptidase